jgi:hypothetical protein
LAGVVCEQLWILNAARTSLPAPTAAGVLPRGGIGNGYQPSCAGHGAGMLPLVREQLNLFIGGVVENDVTTTKGEVRFVHFNAGRGRLSPWQHLRRRFLDAGS